MIHSRLALEEIPDEILETDRVARSTEQAVRKLDSALRQAMARKGLDPRLLTEMQYLLDALRTVKVNLSVLDATVEVVLKEAAGRPPTGCQCTESSQSPPDIPLRRGLPL